MGRELEVFKCPECGAETRVAWPANQPTTRTLACNSCAQDIYETRSVKRRDDDGNEYDELETGGKIVARKGQFSITKGGGVRTEEEKDG